MYVRRWTVDPGDSILLNIESVNILDLTPPANIVGVGSGTVIVVGEFENGPYCTPQQVLGVSDLMATWGTLGYQYSDGSIAAFPSAPVRRADGLAPEYWNGNAFVQMNGLTFASLIFVRVNTSVGTVQFESQAYVEGAIEFGYQLTTGQILALTTATESTNIATAVQLPAATIYVESVTGFPTSGTFTVGGATVTYTGTTGGNNPCFTGCSGGTAAVAAGDVVMGGTISNGSVVFTGVSATVTGSTPSLITLTGLPLVLAYDGNPNFTTTFTSDDTTIAAVASRINAYAGFTFATVNGGDLVLTGKIPGLAGSVQIVSGGTGVLAALGLTQATTAGTGNTQNIGNVTFAEVKHIVENAIAGTKIELNTSGALRASNTASPGTGAIMVSISTTATGLGFTNGEISSAADVASGVIPAGTIVTNTGASALLVTTQDVNVVAGEPGPYKVSVRFAVDDGTGVIQNADTLTVVETTPALGSFAVNNPYATTAALTETQIDAAYATAIATTTSVNNVTRIANVIVSARQSNSVRSALRANALYASAKGSYGRCACVSPPLNTSPQVALGNAAPGVVATRDERVFYCYVGQNSFVPLIGQVGSAGGAGFTATGNVDTHSDMVMASILSRLPPEEDPGQVTTFTANVNGIETGANAQGFDIDDYIAFKAAGIAALRIDEGVAVFQSGVTSVDPSVWPQLTDINRRRMADFIQDSITGPAKAFGKKLSLQARRKALKNEIKGFMFMLLNKNEPGAQRIAGYSVSDQDGNTDTRLSAGMYRITTKVKTINSLKSIVISTTVGTDVVTTEVLPNAA